MKYLPTIDLWADGMTTAICSGQLKLQTGQWVRCGLSKPSRFVRLKGGTIHVVHPQGRRVRKSDFTFACKNW